MPEPDITLTLNADGVVAPTLRAVEESTEIVSFCMKSLDNVDLSEPPQFDGSRLQMKFTGNLNAEERRTRYTNWVLSKGFQDLARGIRSTLEEAYFYIKMANLPAEGGTQKTTWDALQEKIQRFHSQSEAMSFPELMEVVSSNLTSPLHFEKQFLSLQQVRNCLEHRDGVVGERDVKKGAQSLKLSLPQLKMYGERDGRQREIGKGSFVEKGTTIVFRNEIQEREFKLGERITFQAEEFHDIGFGCWAFAQDLKSKLPAIAPATKPSRAPPNRINRLKARLPRGFADRGAAEIAATRQMIETIRQVYERYGFEPVETPAIEYTDALGKFLPDQDRPNEGVFSFQDDDEQWLSLRYDLTAPLARYVAENFDSLPKPYRSYRVGWVFRNEKPGPGRFRQFMQFDADTVGSASPAADAEMCMMAADTIEALGVPRGSYVVKVSNRKVFAGVLESLGLGGEQNAKKRLAVLRAIDKYDRLGLEGVLQLLGKGRWDGGEQGKGDFTTGAELDAQSIHKLKMWLDFENFFTKTETGQAGFGMHNPYYVPPLSWPEIDKKTRPGISLFNRENRERSETENWDRMGAFVRVFYDSQPDLVDGIAELEAIADFVEAAEYDDRVIIDFSVVRGLEYYTGPVFEVELTFSTDGKNGSPRFGSVGGGGRYDGLVSRFRAEPVPATGFSIGVSRLAAALQHLGKIDPRPILGPVVVTILDRDRIADYQAMVTSLRNAGIRAELYLGNPRNFGNQLKYADRRDAPCVIIQGSEEKARGEVQIKDLVAGTEAAIFHDGVGTSREQYLHGRLAQFAVPEEQLVEAVRKVLARHAAGSH